MRIPGGATLHRAFQGLSLKSPLILMYHRVSDAGPDPWGLSVSPAHFSEHLEVLRREAAPTALRALAAKPDRRRRRAVAVTFDDGYADNLLTAAPMLQRVEIPATVFVTTGFLTRSRQCWWDELTDVLLRPGRLPDALEVTIGGRVHRWELGHSAHYDASAYATYRRWPATWEPPPTPRHAAYLEICELLRPLPDAEVGRILGTLLALTGNGAPESPHRMLTEAEAARLGKSGLIEIAAHSVTHPVLPDLPADHQRREIVECKARLEQVVQAPVTSFAYPYGRASDVTARIVQEAGFRLACTADAGFVGRDSDRLRLPRMEVRDCDGDEFARRLARAFQ